MITRLVTIDGVDHTIITPVVNDVVSDIQDKIFKDDDIEVYKDSLYNDESVDVDDHVYNNKIGKAKLFVNYEVEDNEELELTTSTYIAKDKMLLVDHDTGFNIRPISISSDITFSFIYKSKSKLAVQKVKNRLQHYYLTSGYSINHNVSYSYLLPNVLIKLISNISSLKGNPNIYDFIDASAKYAFDYSIKRGSDYKVPTFHGKQSGIIGNITDEPKSIKIGKEDQYYTIEFSYQITIEKPTALAVQYPITVNNMSIDEIWLPKTKIATPIEKSSGSFNIRNIIGTRIYQGLQFNDILIKVPNFDQFAPYNVNSYNDRIKLISLLIQVDPTNMDIILDIDDLAYIGVPNYLVDYMKATTDNELFKFGSSLIHIELFENNFIKDKGLTKNDDNQIVALNHSI